MNKDINKTLMALVPILRMNNEKVQKIESVKNWYTLNGKEYMKEVAEITYNNGYRQYADIGCDSNLTAIYDVIAVIQQIKPESTVIQRIERGIYKPSESERNRMKMIDGHKLILSLNDWWYSTFGLEENEKSKAIKEVIEAVEAYVNKVADEEITEVESEE